MAGAPGRLTVTTQQVESNSIRCTALPCSCYAVESVEKIRALPPCTTIAENKQISYKNPEPTAFATSTQTSFSARAHCPRKLHPSDCAACHQRCRLTAHINNAGQALCGPAVVSLAGCDAVTVVDVAGEWRRRAADASTGGVASARTAPSSDGHTARPDVRGNAADTGTAAVRTRRPPTAGSRAEDATWRRRWWGTRGGTTCSGCRRAVDSTSRTGRHDGPVAASAASSAVSRPTSAAPSCRRCHGCWCGVDCRHQCPRLPARRPRWQ